MLPHNDEQPPYAVGIMQVPVEERDPNFRTVVEHAVQEMEQRLPHAALGLQLDLREFRGPHLSPRAGSYSALDFLQMGFSEAVARRYALLLIVTEVDLSATGKPYVLALSSSIANIGILSTRRLAPEHWGAPDDVEIRGRRLAALMLHSLGHLLELSHSGDPGNVMYDLRTADDLDAMVEVTAAQRAELQRNLPREVREAVARHGRWRFAVQQVLANRAGIWREVVRANPFRLVPQLPAMIAAGLSVMIVLFFSPEMWDVASTVELYQLLFFAGASILAATVVLYRAFSIGAITTRDGALTESSVVMRAATALSLLATVGVLYAGFWLLCYLGVVTIFPAKLMVSWPTVDPAVRPLDHVKLGIFLAAMGVLSGSLGGRAEGKNLIRHVLFFAEET